MFLTDFLNLKDENLDRDTYSLILSLNWLFWNIKHWLGYLIDSSLTQLFILGDRTKEEFNREPFVIEIANKKAQPIPIRLNFFGHYNEIPFDLHYIPVWKMFRRKSNSTYSTIHWRVNGVKRSMKLICPFELIHRFQKKISFLIITYNKECKFCIWLIRGISSWKNKR
jgi:hypothetical protein